MVKTIISLIITMVLFASLVSAGPFYNFTIQVDNLDNIAVENADVHFFADSEYLDFSGITENGEFIFEVDARSYLPTNNTQEMIFTNTNNPNQPNVQNKKNTQSKNGRLTRDFLIPQKTFVLDITSETSEYTFQDYTAQAIVTIDGDKNFEVEVNFDPEFEDNSIEVDVYEDSGESNTINLEDYLIPITNDNDYTINLIDAPNWASVNGDEITFNLLNNAQDLSFEAEIIDDDSGESDTIDIDVSVYNYDAEFTQNEITISVTEDTLSNYDLTNIINSEIDNYDLTIQDNPTWVILNDDELNFDLQVNNPNTIETFQVLLSETMGEPNTKTLDVTLSITNVNDAPTIGNIPNFVIDETDENNKTLNLNSIINDEESNLNDMEIELDYSFSTIDADFEYDYPNIEANFIPELNLDYHTNNNLVFTITITDGENQITSNGATWGYDPFLKALKGNIINHYTTNDVIGNNAITTPNTYPGTNTLTSNSEFIGFYNDEYAQVNIENPSYYESNRYIQLDNDLERDFTIIPIQINTSSGYDNIEAGFNEAFRTGGSNGQFFMGTTKYLEAPIIFICTDSTESGYVPTTDDLQKVNVSLNYFNEFTNGLINPYINTNVIISDDYTACFNAITTPGYLMFYWHNSGGAGANGRTQNGHTLIRSFAYVMTSPTLSQAIYNQELTQAIGPAGDQLNVSPSTFCDNGCLIPNEPVELDFKWMQRNYDRTPGNMENDIDYNPEARNNEFTEVVRIQEKFLPNGEKIKTIEKLGYYYANEMFKSYDQVFKKLPKNAKLIKTIDYSQYVQIPQKIDNKENKKLKKLI